MTPHILPFRQKALYICFLNSNELWSDMAQSRAMLISYKAEFYPRFGGFSAKLCAADQCCLFCALFMNVQQAAWQRSRQAACNSACVPELHGWRGPAQSFLLVAATALPLLVDALQAYAHSCACRNLISRAVYIDQYKQSQLCQQATQICSVCCIADLRGICP
eukprot:414637-Pleurochrysis_carterae.AAC.1